MPLSPEQQKEVKEGIKNAETLLKDARADIATAKTAGIDVADQETQVKDLMRKIRSLKAVYG